MTAFIGDCEGGDFGVCEDQRGGQGVQLEGGGVVPQNRTRRQRERGEVGLVEDGLDEFSRRGVGWAVLWPLLLAVLVRRV